MPRTTITQTAGVFPRATLENAETAETLVNMVNEHAAALDNMTGDGTPAAGTFTTLNATGNCALGDTTADEHTVKGHITATDTVGTSVSIGNKGLVLLDDTAQAAGVGGVLLLGAKYNAAGAYIQGAEVKAAKTNSTDDNYSMDLLFATAPNGGSVTERVRITDQGVLKALGEVEIDGALNHDGASVGFYGTAPIAKQTGVAVTAEAIHAALVALGLIGA